MVATLAFLPFRIIYVPTTWLGRTVAWLAEGYRQATVLEQALIFPSWAVLRVFLVGCVLSRVLHAAGRRALRQ